MKLAYIAGSPMPSRLASSIQVARMCQAFGDAGHDVLLLTPDRPEIERGVQDVHAFYGVRRNFEIRRLPWKPGRLGAYLYAARSARAARAHGSQLVYGRYSAGVFATAMLRTPCIYEGHLWPAAVGRLDARIHRALMRSPRLERVVVISEALKRAYQEYFALPDQRLVVAHDAADVPVVTTPARLGSDGRLQVGYVGNLYRGKGVELILALAARCQWADFHIVGGSDAEAGGWKATAPGNVRFHGFVAPRDTDAIRQACDVLVAPYQQQVSGFGGREIAPWMSPLKVFEYMAAGRAIVASNLPVLREVLEDGKTAHLCDPNDLTAWVEALERLRDDTVLRARLGDDAHRAFLVRHTWRSRADRVLDGLTAGRAD
jgi:glycosyltransferase involved in cell wall biosynthesis